MWRRAIWGFGPALLLGGCLMSRVEFAEGTGASSNGGTGASSNGGTGASSNGGSQSSGASAGETGNQAGSDGEAGEGPGSGGNMPGGGSGGSAPIPDCGNGEIDAGELCDDGNGMADDGCSESCALEPGYICDLVGRLCTETPSCSGGQCIGFCGDGFKKNSEGCDDGNVSDTDGCSATCSVPSGWTCSTLTSAGEQPQQLVFPVVYRDLITQGLDGAVKHPDLQTFAGLSGTEGLVEDVLVNDLPAYTGLCEQAGPSCPDGAQTTSSTAFQAWFNDVAGVNVRVDDVLVLDRVGASADYEFDGGSKFSPVLGRGWDALGKEALVDDVNFGFTTELRIPFMLRGDELITFTGDDDVWIFVNNQLIIDLGGMHTKQTASFTLGLEERTNLGMNVGELYELAIFHAERAPTESNFKLRLRNFVRELSVCTQ